MLVITTIFPLLSKQTSLMEKTNNSNPTRRFCNGKLATNFIGVDEVDVDMNMQKVTVLGWTNQEKILKTIRKTGRKAELWPFTPESQHNGVVQEFHQNYYNSQSHDNHNTFVDYHVSPPFTAFDAPISPSVMSYNYLTAAHYYGGGEDDRQSVAPYSTIVDDNASAMFSDENPHACSIM